MNTFTPNENGFVVNWLLSGPYVTKPHTDIRDTNQLSFEKKLRAVIASDDMSAPPVDIAPGLPGVGGEKWRFYAPGRDWFVDVSKFYHLLQKVEVWAACDLYADAPLSLRAVMWTYAAADVWLNGERVLINTPPVYKPIKREPLALSLKPGANRLFVRMQTLGARDTRTLFALQIEESASRVRVSLPDPQGALAPVIDAAGWLDGLRAENGFLVAERAPAGGAEVADSPADARPWKTGECFSLEQGARRATVRAVAGEYALERTLEMYENAAPAPFSTEESDDARFARVFSALADRSRGEGGILNALCRFALGTNDERDLKIVEKSIENVESHADCSDFTLCGLIRLFRRFPVDDALFMRFKRAALDYRYWMNEDGADAMCFWSENHSLLFFGNELLAGDMFPDERFPRSRMTGREKRALGAEKCRQWLKSVGALGFEEFLSSSYMAVTTAALLNLIDFGPEDIAQSAENVLDGLLRQHALHTFDGSVIAPQGRVYRDVISPFAQGTQALIDFAIPGARMGASAWMGAFCASKYRPPKDLARTAAFTGETEHLNGNARIRVNKRGYYMLTSCQSPRGEGEGWSNRAYEEENPDVTGRFSYAYVKALNERFHGTTKIEPGVYGYQQHLMYAALSAKCVSFVNHPGGTTDASFMRPGYWYGNGLMPAIRQEGPVLGAIYCLDDRHPIPFTHVFWPNCAFDEVRERGSWLFGRKGEGYMALWTSGERAPVNDMLTGCEYRVYAPRAAYLYVMGEAGEYTDFDAFVAAVPKAAPAFDADRRTLTYARDFTLSFEARDNPSQYV